MAKKSWGKILVGTRLEKMVTDDFFVTWTSLITGGLRPGDQYAIARGQVAHRAANQLARELLKTDCDALFFVDSDADFNPEFLSQFRDFEPGWEYDVLQAFYVRRGWPPEAVWLKKDSEGVLKKCVILGDETEETAIAGLHATLIRREVFEALHDANNKHHDWFYYPKHTLSTEDAAFSEDAIKAGFKVGATSHVKANHITSLILGWDAYQEYLYTSGFTKRIDRYNELMQFMTQFTDLSDDAIANKSAKGCNNVNIAWAGAAPENAVQVRQFYGAEDNGYIYDLFSWNTSLAYIRLTEPLREFTGENVLIIGSGLGSEAALLASKNTVDAFELPGILKKFSIFRLGDKVRFLNGDRFEQAGGFRFDQYSLIVAIDTIEHIHPDEIETFLETIASKLQPGGAFYCHANFGEQDKYPMHYNHQAAFEAWIERHGLVQETQLIWRKPRSGE